MALLTESETVSHPFLRVFLRARPPHSLVSTQLQAPQAKLGDFDGVFDASASQVDVYRAVAEPLINVVLDGVNACVFAFGVTGAGKTYSMLGPEGGKMSEKALTDETNAHAGMVPRTALQMFRSI